VERERAGAAARTALVDEWAAANRRSRELHEDARRVLPGGLAHDVRRADPFPLAVARARGARKWDVDGHELVCYVMGHGALLLGHAHPAVVEAIRAQARVALHPGACHELERAWAAEVVRLVPSAERVRFTSSGTEATMLALQVARAFTGRPRLVKLVGHFHGWHDWAAFGVDPPFARPATPGIPAAVANLVSVLPPELPAVERTLAAGDVAAVMLEPSGAAWGAVPLPEGFLAGVRALCDEHGAVLVFDEVVTGFRWSPGGAQELAGVVPDLTALAKVLAGGMPGGALAGRAEVMEVLAFRREGETKVSHPGTHNAHPVSAAAGIATLRRSAFSSGSTVRPRVSTPPSSSAVSRSRSRQRFTAECFCAAFTSSTAVAS
jgi:glutamate-1-semialdehyde 2,1-aminomutase